MVLMFCTQNTSAERPDLPTDKNTSRKWGIQLNVAEHLIHLHTPCSSDARAPEVKKPIPVTRGFELGGRTERGYEFVEPSADTV
jgi:hypothetical protein